MVESSNSTNTSLYAFLNRVKHLDPAYRNAPGRTKIQNIIIDHNIIGSTASPAASVTADVAANPPLPSLEASVKEVGDAGGHDR